MLGESKQTFHLRILLSTIGLLMCVPLKSAEPSPNKADWNNLKQLMSGQEIQIALKDAKSFQGKFHSVSDEALVMRSSTGEQSFNRQSVLRVSTKGQGHRGRNAGLGAAIGFGVGAAIGAAAGNPQAIGGRGVPALVGAVLGLPIGAVVGIALPSSAWREVYRAR